MKKEGIRIPSIAAKVFVFSFLGAGACACLVLTVLYALWGEFVTAAFTVVGMVVFIAGIRFEKRMGDDHYRLDEAGIQIVRDRKTTDFIPWKDMTGVVIRHAPTGCTLNFACGSWRMAFALRTSVSPSHRPFCAQSALSYLIR